MSGLFEKLRYNISGQLVARLSSFLINMYLLRIVDASVIGLVNVRLMLLYDTILFLTREPMRKSPLLKSSLEQFINLIWLSPLISTVLSILIVPFWMSFSSTPLSIPVVLSFASSAIIESFAEPFCIISLRFSLDYHFGLSQGLLILLKRLFVLLFILSSTVDHISLFCYAQVIAAISFVVFHVLSFYRYIGQQRNELQQFNSFRDFFPRFSYGIDKSSASTVRTLLFHSVLKQALTDGSSFVMTFTQLLTLPQQGVYDAIERLGSLFSRMFLAPLEESSFAYFSNVVNSSHGQNKSEKERLREVVETFGSLLHDLVVCGLIVCTFGVPYSSIAVKLYGGQLLVQNGGAYLLATYAVYVMITAINGVTEGFAFATMNRGDVLSHSGFLILAAIGHLSLSFCLCSLYGAVGFILANMINMLIRIVYSWRHISHFLEESRPSISRLSPSFSTVFQLLFVFGGCCISQLLFGSTPGISHTLANLAVGAVLFIVVIIQIFHQEQLFHHLLKGEKQR